MLQGNKIVNKKVVNAGELISNAVYLIATKSNTNWYWEEHVNKVSFIIATLTISHPCLDVGTIKYFTYIYRSLCNQSSHKELFKIILFISIIKIMTTF